ncbi:hypothetical protein VZT92_012738 [Zoarces viviparus]|uniref:Uncharacterized protein n=1 Tax=Zoarces viviparus TaxID=48416 RepID=A0AAW1F2W0_ZOAVI
MRQPHVILTMRKHSPANQRPGECRGRGSRVALWKIVRRIHGDNVRSQIDKSDIKTGLTVRPRTGSEWRQSEKRMRLLRHWRETCSGSTQRTHNFRMVLLKGLLPRELVSDGVLEYKILSSTI